MRYQAIEFATDDAVATITFNRPDSLNALTPALMQETLQALQTAAEDDAIRAIILTANGRAFSSGADLKESVEPDDKGQINLGALLRSNYHAVVETMRSIEKPIVGAVQGMAVGAGCSLALMTDIVVAAESARFQQIFTRIGLIPDAGSTYILPRLAGHARASAAILTGDAIPAKDAQQWGLIWQVVADDALETTARELAQTLAERPTRALGLAKKALMTSQNNNLSEQLKTEAALQTECGQTQDFAEAVDAFINKRTPQFKGY